MRRLKAVLSLMLAAEIMVPSAMAAGLVDPADNPISAIKIALGRRLFYDADLSVNGTMSCATCHEQKKGFTDGNQTHPAATGEAGKRNVPGLANVASFQNLTWADNHLKGLEQQALIPILGTAPVEMGVKGHENDVVARFATDPCYVRLFAAAFPGRGGEVSLETLTMAIASFERTLISANSPYDLAKRAGRSLPSAKAVAGEALFEKAGCVSCHAGENFSDDAFHMVQTGGVVETRDEGLVAVTGNPEDRGLFRTPGLRNVAITAPYWHDGSAPTLGQAIAKHDPASGVPALDDTAIAELAAFLTTLTDRTFITDKRFLLPPEACPLKK